MNVDMNIMDVLCRGLSRLSKTGISRKRKEINGEIGSVPINDLETTQPSRTIDRPIVSHLNCGKQQMLVGQAFLNQTIEEVPQNYNR